MEPAQALLEEEGKQAYRDHQRHEREERLARGELGPAIDDPGSEQQGDDDRGAADERAASTATAHEPADQPVLPVARWAE